VNKSKSNSLYSFIYFYYPGKPTANQQEWKITKYPKYIIDNIFGYFSYSQYPVHIVNSEDISFNNISQLTEFGPENFFSKISNEYKNNPAVQFNF
jgi:hypothetical protein